MQQRRLTPECKSQAVLEVLTGAASVAVVCRQHRLTHQVLARWKAEWLDRAPHLFAVDPQRDADQARIAEWERLAGRLTLEVES